MNYLTSAVSVVSLMALLLFSGTVSARTLNVYTYSSFTSSWGPGPELKTRFEAVCDCELRFTSSDDGVSLLNRLHLEGDRTRADVVLGLDTMLMPQARRLGLVQSHDLRLEDWPLKASLDWQDAQFIPFDYGYFAFIYNRHQVDDPVDSLEALLSSDASVLYQDPRTSTPGQGLMHWIQAVYGDRSADAWQRLARNTVTVTKGWSEAYGMFLQGETDYVLSYTTSPAYHQLVESSDAYVATRFAEGHIAQVEVAAISAYSQNVALAQAFLAFLLEAEVQAVIAQHNWMLPVRDDVTLPEVFQQAERDVIQVSADLADRQRREWLQVWRSAVSR